MGEILKSLSPQDKQSLKASSKALYDKVSAFATRINLRNRIPVDSPFFKNLNQFKNWVEVTLGDDRGSRLNTEAKRAMLTSLLDFLPEMTNLKDLGIMAIGGIPFDETIVRALADRLPSGLEALDLTDRHIGDAGLKILAPKLPPSLKGLWLSSNDIGPEGLRALMAAFPNLPNLEKLVLGSNISVKPEVPSLIEALSKMPRLVELMLSPSLIDEAIAAKLPAILPQTYLRYLYFRNTRLPDAAKQNLQNLRNVKGEPIRIWL